ncbi:hypothetical protein JWG45_09780 [Leptospira sp. 201903070]|uniref:Tetratricopeptide repeat protein n=1 Tax=Leptospira ainlahdjerensis TaxID=2810033 RepID=A0ABS2UDY5_9LEPT|nr:hypothetical protein [Leptospira ainlahdjerensis]MBM9577442.1 hypothetical protein [Leptospira ainlahdjerensis]
MNENYKIPNLPKDLVEDLKFERRVETDSQGWFDLASVEEFHFSSVKIGPFKEEERGQYYTNSVGLIKNSEAYDEDPEILVWLPRLQLYGTWDSSHDELHVFPNQTWISMKSDLVPFIETQWRSYEGKNKIACSTLEGPDEYSDAFDFIAYGLKETVDKISDEELAEFLNKHETGILNHPNVSSLDHAYFALANVYFRMGKMDPSQEGLWKEKCLRVLNFYPEDAFHHEREAAEICAWVSADFGFKTFQNLLEKDKRQPEYGGGASLISALLLYHPNRWESILEISKIQKYTIGVLHSVETAKNWALTVINDPLAAKIKQNRKAMDLASNLIIQIDNFILSMPSGTFSDREIHNSRHKKIVERLVQGWEFLKKKEYSKTEELLTSIFLDYPGNAEALFLDARLHWLKSGSPEEGMKRAEKNLPIAAVGDHAGRSRLHNLVGCALDEMGRWEESIRSFQDAEKLSPEESIYPANIAEIFWKLKDEKSANRYAKKAQSLGNRSEIVEKILQETKELK